MSHENKCFICGTEDTFDEDIKIFNKEDVVIKIFNCPNCGKIGYLKGGKFNQINVSVENHDKYAIIACEKKLKGYDNYILCNYMPHIRIINTFKELTKMDFVTCENFIDNYKDPKPHEIFDRSLQNLEELGGEHGEELEISSLSLFYSKDVNQRDYVIKELEKKGYIIQRNDKYICQIASKGWQRLSELDKTTTDSNQAFVAMWFNDSMKDIYENGIKKAIEESGYDPLKINDKPHNNSITNEIIAEIKRSKFMVADFTGLRAGVYYEAGFARGLGKEVISIVQEDDLKKLHFDTKQINHITYKDAGDLYKKLLNHIRATI